MSLASAGHQLKNLGASLAQWRSGGCDAHAFVQAWRAEASVLQALPEKYTSVFNNLLLRVESSALFTEESCSFSAKDLADSLSVWLDKATATLAKEA